MTPSDQSKSMEGTAKLDPRTAELVAIGASVAGHCQPCLTYHVGKARELGVSDDLIREAISMGQRVEGGATSAMREFAKTAVEAVPRNVSSCCSDGPPKDGGRCCG